MNPMWKIITADGADSQIYKINRFKIERGPPADGPFPALLTKR